jgi:3-deoxy-D-manno-octulosonic-acid transferase
MISIFFFFYELVWIILIPILYILSRTIVPKWRNGFKQRMGLDLGSFPSKPIWFHAVSVGELNALIPLLTFFDGFNIVLSTTTESSQELAQKKFAHKIDEGRIKLIYMPFDSPSTIEKTFMLIKPEALIIMETEIWPSLIHTASQKQVPIAIINARLADKSFNNYKKAYFFFHWIFNKISLVLAQTPEDSRKFLSLNVSPEKVFMTGNIKFAVLPSSKKDQNPDLKRSMGFNYGDLVIIAASTHVGEEAAILSMYQELRLKYANLKLAIAPRHPDRFSVVEELILSAAKLNPVRYSKTSFKKKNEDNELLKSEDILLVDTIGDLMNFFAISDIAFVGGTLVDGIGGHNVLEPAAFALPVVVGPFYYKNTDIVEQMEKAGALEVVESKLELKEFMELLLESKERRVIMGSQAYKIVTENRKILKTIADKLNEFIIKESNVVI